MTLDLLDQQHFGYKSTVKILSKISVAMNLAENTDNRGFRAETTQMNGKW